MTKAAEPAPNHPAVLEALFVSPQFDEGECIRQVGRGRKNKGIHETLMRSGCGELIASVGDC